MPDSIPSYRSRPLNLWLMLALPLALVALLLMFEPVTLDLTLAQWMYRPGEGFIGRHSWFLENILHDRAKQLVILLSVAALVAWLGGFFYAPLRPYRRTLGYLVLAMGIAASIVTPLKALTAVQCPWDLAQFGGKEIYSSLLSHRPPTDHPGRCWPGGHASSGFVLFALYFALRDRKPRLARYAFWFALGLGCVFSVSRMLQGAHFLSHNIWTALFDWLICLGFYALLLYRPATQPDAAVSANLTTADSP
ncbi:phosphatase PAP2 family protein [Pseudomonas sp. MT3]